MRLPRAPTRLAVLPLAALALGGCVGCGRSGYGTVDAHQLVLIPAAPPVTAAGRRADAALVCGARAQARRLHRALRVARPRTGTASAQIAVADAVTAEKPGGVLIVPVAPDAMLAPILSMRRAGIQVVRLKAPRGSAAAAVGARAVARVVAGIDGAKRDTGDIPAVSLPVSCASAR